MCYSSITTSILFFLSGNILKQTCILLKFHFPRSFPAGEPELHPYYGDVFVGQVFLHFEVCFLCYVGGDVMEHRYLGMWHQHVKICRAIF